MSDESTSLKERPVSPVRPEAVIREARRRQHRRRVTAGIVAIVVVAGTILGVELSRPVATSGRTATAPTAKRSPPVGQVGGVQPTQPGPLAVAPDGTLYIADEAQSRLLARVPSGQFRVIAGDGKAGFSGDGGPAVDAELDGPEGIAVGANGTIYFVDRFNNRIRAVLPDGTITTVAGNGQESTPDVPPPVGSPATQVAIGQPTAVAIGPGGSVYFAESADILRMETNGDLAVVEDASTFSSFDPSLMFDQQCFPASLAFSSSGSLYIGCSSPWVLLVQAVNGPLRSLGSLRPHDAWAALTPSPDGGVLAIGGAEILAYGSGAQPPDADFLTYRLPDDGGLFWPQGIAVAANGTIYLAQDGVSGIGPAAILEELPGGTVSVLWQSQSSNERVRGSKA
jgi:hypothetical protein